MTSESGFEAAVARRAEKERVRLTAGRLTVRLPADWATELLSIRSTPLYTAVYDRLVAFGSDGEVVPYLAESWEASPTRIVFRLRGGVTDSAGAAVTASTIKAALDYSLDPLTTARLPAFAGPGPFRIDADDAGRRLTIESQTPNNELLAAFAGVNAIIAPRGQLDGGQLDPDAAGSGPYVLDDLTPGESVRLRRRAGWAWGPPGSRPDQMPAELEFLVVPEDHDAEELLLRGEMHVARLGRVSERIDQDPDLVQHHARSTTAHQVVCNLGREPFASNELLRRAIFTALDRQRVLHEHLGSACEPTNSVFATVTQCYADQAHLIPTPDLQEARRLLEAAGYTRRGEQVVGPDGEPLAATILTLPAHEAATDYIRDRLTDLGLRIKCRRADGWSDYIAAYIRSDFDIVILGGAGAGPTPTIMARFISGPPLEEGGSNYVRVRDPELDRLAHAARAATLDDRDELWAQFQAHYLSHHYGLPTGSPVATYVTRGCQIAVTKAADTFEAWTLKV